MRKIQFAITVSFLLDGCQADDVHGPAIQTCTDPDVERTPLPDVPLVRQSEHLDFYSEAFVCAGTARDLERHVTFVAESVGVDLRKNIPVVFSADSPVQCGGKARGCAMDDGTVFTMPRAIYHELNHSVACQLRSYTRPKVNALVEGFAVMYDQSPWVSRKYENISLLEVFADSTPSYPTSGHFFRWLLEREGPETIADVYRTPIGHEHFPGVLEDFYGLPFAQLEAEYYATSPLMWAPFRQCADLPHVEPNADGVWRYSGPPMDCDADMTMGPYLREWLLTPGNELDLMYQSFTFSIEGDEGFYLDYMLSDGLYEVNFERCLEEHVQNPNEEPFLSLLPMIPKIDGGQTYPHICPGKWRANVLRLHSETDVTQPTEAAFWQIIDSPIDLPPQSCHK